MGFADLYLGKQGFSPCFPDAPSPFLRVVVVIPAYREPYIIRTLESLYACTRPAAHAEVIVVPNRPESADISTREQTRQMQAEISDWIKKHDQPALRFLQMPEQVMPDRDAGVGMARKTGMDQAVARFNAIGCSSGLVMCFDADSLCTPDYFTSLEDTLLRFPRMRGCNLYFEHPLSGPEFPEPVYRAIAGYELHLRYMNLYNRYTGFPYAYHTIGSCFGVRAETYAREGGMNKRKAGEDFYFLNKVIPLGEFREINTTCVIPSPRLSDRVPFGTGAAIARYLQEDKAEILTYNPECYQGLKALFDRVPELYDKARPDVHNLLKGLPEPMACFLRENRAQEAIEEARMNSASGQAFVARFYRWFNAFRIIKYLNYATRNHYRQMEVGEAARTCLRVTRNDSAPENVEELLRLFRKLERDR